MRRRATSSAASSSLHRRTRSWRNGPIYVDAFQEFARREAVLERHRPGFKRWGPKWITQAEFDEMLAKDRDLMQEIYDQGRLINRLNLSVTTLGEQFNTAATRANGFSNHVHIRRHNDPIVINPPPCPVCAAMYEAGQSARRSTPS